MEQVIKQFSLIDFLGIALPGAALILTVNYYIWDLTTPCIKFFGLNTIVLAVYFVALSYLCGGILHQLGMGIERLLPDEKNVFDSHYQREAIKKVYEQRFDTPFPDDAISQIKAGREIFHHVQRKNRSQRIVTFSAFYAMSRTLLATIPLLFVVVAISNSITLPIFLIYAVAWIICLLRWRYFDQCCISEAYTIFVAEDIT